MALAGVEHWNLRLTLTRSIVCDFRLSLFLKSFDPSDPILSFVRLLEYSRESWTCLSSSSSEEELGRARMTCTRRRLRECSSSTCASPCSSLIRPKIGKDHSTGLKGYELAKREN